VKKVSLKRKILFYSDCSFFAGCENMLISLFNSPAVREEFDITFVYRYSPLYEEGLNARLKQPIQRIPLHLPSADRLYESIDQIENDFCKKFLRIGVQVLCVKYFLFLFSILKLFFTFRKIQPDILHVNNGGYPGAHSCVAAILVAKTLGIQKIVFVINNL